MAAATGNDIKNGPALLGDDDKDPEVSTAQESEVKESKEKRTGKGRPRELSRTKLERLNAKVDRSGIVYMSRVPPHLKPLKLRQLLEPYARLGRIYMAPKASPPGEPLGSTSAADKAKRRNAKNEFAEAWIEFEDKKLGRAVTEMLNGQPMGGPRRSRHREDLWTLKYLPKFKWDHLTDEIAYEKAVREKRLAQELARAKAERDFYLGKVAQARKNEAIMSRKRKKREGEGSAADSRRVCGADSGTAGAGVEGEGEREAGGGGAAGSGGGEGSGKMRRPFGQRAPIPAGAADARTFGGDELWG